MSTYKHVQTTCPECKHDIILHDEHRQETFCEKCGLIIHDNTIFKITTVIEREENRNKWLNDFWRKTNTEIKLKRMRDIYK